MDTDNKYVLHCPSGVGRYIDHNSNSPFRGGGQTTLFEEVLLTFFIHSFFYSFCVLHLQRRKPRAKGQRPNAVG